MALCPFTDQHLIAANHVAGQMRTPVMGVVIHHTVGSLASAESRFNTPGSGASAHFGIGEDGTILQWVDTADVAYHACNANWTGWIGIEHETPGDGPGLWQALTDAQLTASARVLAWAAATHGFPLQVTDDPSTLGLAYHSMYPGDCATHWGITGCPGDAIIAQRPEIIARASGTIPPPAPTPAPEGDQVSYVVYSIRENGTEVAVGSAVDGLLRHGNDPVLDGGGQAVPHLYAVVTKADWDRLVAWQTAPTGATSGASVPFPTKFSGTFSQ